jgi:hypothetical protein
MPTEKPTGGASPARPQLMPPAAWMVYGLGLAMLTGVLRTIYGGRDPNSIFITAGIIVLVCMAVPALLNIRQSKWRIVKCVASASYTGVLMAGMFMFLGGTVVGGWFEDTAKVQEFVARDFRQFEKDGSVARADIDAELARQAELRSQLRQLEGVHKQIDATAGGAATKWAANTGVSALETELKLELLPDEQVERMSVVSRDMHIVSDTGTATRWQLANFRHTLSVRYPLWQWLLEKCGLL